METQAMRGAPSTHLFSGNTMLVFGGLHPENKTATDKYRKIDINIWKDDWLFESPSFHQYHCQISQLTGQSLFLFTTGFLTSQISGFSRRISEPSIFPTYDKKKLPHPLPPRSLSRLVERSLAYESQRYDFFSEKKWDKIKKVSTFRILQKTNIKFAPEKRPKPICFESS